MLCVSMCMDDAANMTGNQGSLKALVKEKNSSVQWIYCIIQWQSLAVKHLSMELNKTLSSDQCCELWEVTCSELMALLIGLSAHE